MDEIHTRTLHPYGASSKNQHKSKSHQHHEKSEFSNVESAKGEKPSKGKRELFKKKH